MNEEPERLKIPADLDREAEELLAEVAPAHSGPVTVSVGAKSGKIRRNGPCPCGSGRKYKNCCLEKVNRGELPRVRAWGSSKRIPTKYDPPKIDHSKYVMRDDAPAKVFRGRYVGPIEEYRDRTADVWILNTKWLMARFDGCEPSSPFKIDHFEFIDPENEEA